MSKIKFSRGNESNLPSELDSNVVYITKDTGKIFSNDHIWDSKKEFDDNHLIPKSAFPGPYVEPDDYVMINGVPWATRNIDLSTEDGFAPTPLDSGMLFQYNRNVGWSATDPLRRWNNITKEWETAPWDNTPVTLGSWVNQEEICPPGWRLPTISEMESLVAAGWRWVEEIIQLGGYLFMGVGGRDLIFMGHFTRWNGHMMGWSTTYWGNGTTLELGNMYSMGTPFFHLDNNLIENDSQYLSSFIRPVKDLSLEEKETYDHGTVANTYNFSKDKDNNLLVEGKKSYFNEAGEKTYYDESYKIPIGDGKPTAWELIKPIYPNQFNPREIYIEPSEERLACAELGLQWVDTAELFEWLRHKSFDCTVDIEGVTLPQNTVIRDVEALNGYTIDITEPIVSSQNSSIRLENLKGSFRFSGVVVESGGFINSVFAVNCNNLVIGTDVLERMTVLNSRISTGQGAIPNINSLELVGSSYDAEGTHVIENLSIDSKSLFITSGSEENESIKNIINEGTLHIREDSDPDSPATIEILVDKGIVIDNRNGNYLDTFARRVVKFNDIEDIITDGTSQEFTESLVDRGFGLGTRLMGYVYFTDLPFSGNAEIVIDFFNNELFTATLLSTNTAPFSWNYTGSLGHAITWRSGGGGGLPTLPEEDFRYGLQDMGNGTEVVKLDADNIPMAAQAARSIPFADVALGVFLNGATWRFDQDTFRNILDFDSTTGQGTQNAGFDFSTIQGGTSFGGGLSSSLILDGNNVHVGWKYITHITGGGMNTEGVGWSGDLYRHEVDVMDTLWSATNNNFIPAGIPQDTGIYNVEFDYNQLVITMPEFVVPADSALTGFSSELNRLEGSLEVQAVSSISIGDEIRSMLGGMGEIIESTRLKRVIRPTTNNQGVCSMSIFRPQGLSGDIPLSTGFTMTCPEESTFVRGILRFGQPAGVGSHNVDILFSTPNINWSLCGSSPNTVSVRLNGISGSTYIIEWDNPHIGVTISLLNSVVGHSNIGHLNRSPITTAFLSIAANITAIRLQNFLRLHYFSRGGRLMIMGREGDAPFRSFSATVDITNDTLDRRDTAVLIDWRSDIPTMQKEDILAGFSLNSDTNNPNFFVLRRIDGAPLFPNFNGNFHISLVALGPSLDLSNTLSTTAGSGMLVLNPWKDMTGPGDNVVKNYTHTEDPLVMNLSYTKDITKLLQEMPRLAQVILFFSTITETGTYILPDGDPENFKEIAQGFVEAGLIEMSATLNDLSMTFSPLAAVNVDGYTEVCGIFTRPSLPISLMTSPSWELKVFVDTDGVLKVDADFSGDVRIADSDKYLSFVAAGEGSRTVEGPWNFQSASSAAGTYFYIDPSQFHSITEITSIGGLVSSRGSADYTWHLLYLDDNSEQLIHTVTDPDATWNFDVMLPFAARITTCLQAGSRVGLIRRTDTGTRSLHQSHIVNLGAPSFITFDIDTSTEDRGMRANFRLVESADIDAIDVIGKDDTIQSTLRTAPRLEAKVQWMEDEVTKHITDLSCGFSNVQDFAVSIENRISTGARADNRVPSQSEVESMIGLMYARPLTFDAVGAAFPTRAALTSATTFFYQGVPIIQTPTVNDTAVVLVDEDNDGAQTKYRFDGVGWVLALRINASPFTTEQQAAIDSLVTNAWRQGVNTFMSSFSYTIPPTGTDFVREEMPYKHTETIGGVATEFPVFRAYIRNTNTVGVAASTWRNIAPLGLLAPDIPPNMRLLDTRFLMNNAHLAPTTLRLSLVEDSIQILWPTAGTSAPGGMRDTASWLVVEYARITATM